MYVYILFFNRIIIFHFLGLFQFTSRYQLTDSVQVQSVFKRDMSRFVFYFHSVFHMFERTKGNLREENERIVESAVLCFQFIDNFCVEGYGYVYKQLFNTCVVREM